MNKRITKGAICSVLAALSVTSGVCAMENNRGSAQKTMKRSNSSTNLRTGLTLGGGSLGIGAMAALMYYAYENGMFLSKPAELPPATVIGTPCLTEMQMKYWKNNLKSIVTPVGKNPGIGVEVSRYEAKKNLDTSPFIKHLGNGKDFECENSVGGCGTRLEMFLRDDSEKKHGAVHYETLEQKLKDLETRKPDFAERGEKLLRILGYDIKDDNDLNTLASLIRQNSYLDDNHKCITISLTTKQFVNKSRKVWFAFDGDMPTYRNDWEKRYQFALIEAKGLEMKFDYGLFHSDGCSGTDNRKNIYKIYSDRIEKLDFPKRKEN